MDEQNLPQQINNLNEENQKLKQDNGDFQKEIENLKFQNNQQQDQINENEKKIGDLETELNEIQSELISVQEKYQTSKQNCQNLMETNGILQDQNRYIDTLKKENELLQTKLINEIQSHNESEKLQDQEFQNLKDKYEQEQKKYAQFEQINECPKPPNFKSIIQYDNKIELYFTESEIIKQSDYINMYMRRVDINKQYDPVIIENPKEHTINDLDSNTKYELMFQSCKMINGELKISKKTEPLTVQTLQSQVEIKEFKKKVRDIYNEYKMSKLQLYAQLNRINIMLLGGIGQGKTSVNNILVKSLQGKNAIIGQKSGSSCQSDTQQFNKIYLNFANNIYLQDFWGYSQNIENDNYDKIVPKILLKGAQETLIYDKRKDLQEMEKCLLSGDLNSQSHLALIVINISNYQGGLVQEYSKLIKLVRNSNIPLLIILSHFDIWYEQRYNQPFKLQSVPNNLIQQCKNTFIEINREAQCDIVSDQNDIQVMICSQDGTCSKKAIKQLALLTINNMMKMAHTYVHQLIKEKLSIIDQNDQFICSLNFPNRNLNLEDLQKEVEWITKQQDTIFLNKQNNKEPVNKAYYKEMRVEDITFPYSLDQDKTDKFAQVSAVRILQENSVPNSISKSQKSKSKQDTDSQQQFLKSQSKKAKYTSSSKMDDDAEEIENDDNSEEEDEEKNQSVVITREFFNKLNSGNQKKIKGKKQVDLRKDLFFIQRTEDNKYKLTADDVIKNIFQKDLFISLFDLVQKMDQIYQTLNQISKEEHREQDQEEESKDNSQHSTGQSSNDEAKPLTFYKDRQFVRLLNIDNCREGDLVQFAYISNEELKNLTLADALIGQAIITIESKEQQKNEKADHILLYHQETKEYHLINGKIDTEMPIQDLRNKFTKQHENLKIAQFLDRDDVILQYNKQKKIEMNEDIPISSCYYNKQQFIVLKYSTKQ